MSTTETKVTHTPGPRTVHQNDREGIHVLAQPHGIIVAEYFNSEADALLDAAAPDMLEALEQLLSDSKEFHDTEFDEKSGTHTNCGWCMAKKAIARAKGGAA